MAPGDLVGGKGTTDQAWRQGEKIRGDSHNSGQRWWDLLMDRWELGGKGRSQGRCRDC